MTEKHLRELLDSTESIKGALESISDSLSEINDSLSALAGCVGYIPPNPVQQDGYFIFRIGGHVGTDN